MEAIAANPDAVWEPFLIQTDDDGSTSYYSQNPTYNFAGDLRMLITLSNNDIFVSWILCAMMERITVSLKNIIRIM